MLLMMISFSHFTFSTCIFLSLIPMLLLLPHEVTMIKRERARKTTMLLARPSLISRVSQSLGNHSWCLFIRFKIKYVHCMLIDDYAVMFIKLPSEKKPGKSYCRQHSKTLISLAPDSSDQM